MAYFNSAFGKAFFAKTLKNAPTVGGVVQTSANLTATGDIAFIGADYKVLSAAGIANVASGFYLAQGSFMANDKIGNNPGHGGYKETTKSKMILKKYISNMWITECNNETADTTIIEIAPISGNATSGGAGGTISKSCFPCGTDPILRVDVKGTAALRLLNHNAYQSLSGSLPMVPKTGTAPANGVDMCCLAQDLNAAGTTGHSGIAPSIVAINFRDQFNNDPIMNKLGTAKLYVNRGATVTTFDEVVAGSAQETAIYAGGAAGVTYTTAAGNPDTLTGITSATAAASSHFSSNLYRLEIKLFTSCQLQTQFTSCSFDTRDFYLLGGLKTILSLQDEVGEPCVACQGYVTDVLSTDASTPKAVAFKQRRTSADTAINDILLTENYRQSPYNQGNRDSSRFREQEGMAGIVTELGRDGGTAAGEACNGKYKVYHLLHNVPRFNNPSGIFDNDQYHYRVYTACSGGLDLDSEWLNIAVDAGVTTMDGGGIVSTVADLVEKGGNL